MSYLEIFKEACESLGEGYFELVKSLLSPHLGEDPFSKVFDDPSEFLSSLRVALGSEADSFLVALASTLRRRGADVNARFLERVMESGDRGKVRAIFESVNTIPLEVGYRELILKQLSELSVSRRRRVIISSLLLGIGVLSLVNMITLILKEYINEQTLNNILVIGLIVSIALAIENYLINLPGVPRARLSVRVRLVDPSALNRTKIPELAEAIKRSKRLELDLAELSRTSSTPLPDLISEMVRLQREGAIEFEFHR